MTLLLIIFLFILGTILGSFGGVIIERGKDGYSRSDRGKVFGGRSYCPGCDGKLLTRRQLIPLVGRLLQRGKCYRCHLPIPQWYCRIELIMGVMFVITGLGVVGVSPDLLTLEAMLPQMIGRLLVNRLLTLIVIHDIQTQELNLYAWVILFGVSVVHIFMMPEAIWTGGFVGAVVMSVVFGVIYLGAKRYATRLNDGQETEGFGEGDVMVAMLLGLLSGPLIASRGVVMSVQMMLAYLVVSSGLGLVFFGLTQGIQTLKHQKIPFLPAMIIAWWIIAVMSSFGVQFFS